MDLYDSIYLKKSRQVYEESLAGGAIQKTKKEEPAPAEAPAPKRRETAMRASQTLSLVSPRKKPERNENSKISMFKEDFTEK